MRIRSKDKSQLRMVLINLDDYVPQDDILRQLDKEVDLSFINPKLKQYYKNSDRGAPAEDPERIFRLLIVMIMEGIRSERQLINRAIADLRIRWYVGYDIDEPIIEHSTISKFRKRIGKEGFDEILTEVIQQCIDKGYIGNQDISVDRTDFHANATVLKGREQALVLTREITKTLESSESCEKIISGSDKNRPNSQSKEKLANIITEITKVKPRDKKWVVDRIKKYFETATKDNKTTKDNNEEYAFTKKKMQLCNDWQLNEQQKQKLKESLTSSTEDLKDTLSEIEQQMPVSRSDYDARHGRTSVKKSFFGYNVNMIMDHKENIITSIEASPGVTHGHEVFDSVYEKHKKRCGGTPASVRADAEYDTYSLRKKLQRDKVATYIHDAHKTGPKDLSNGKSFTVTKNKQIICPAGRKMQYLKSKISKEGKPIVVFMGVGCRRCKYKPICTRSEKSGRWLEINFDEYRLRQKIKAFNKTDVFKSEMKKRWQLEARFGHGKTYHNLKKAMYRGLEKVEQQAKLIATVLNMERMAKLSNKIKTNKRKFQAKTWFLTPQLGKI